MIAANARDRDDRERRRDLDEPVGHRSSSPRKPVPVLSDDHVRLLLADCSGKDFSNRPDCAIIRLFLDTGMRLEGMGGLCHSQDDAELSDMDLTSRVARIIAKRRRELVLPIGACPPEIVLVAAKQHRL